MMLNKKERLEKNKKKFDIRRKSLKKSIIQIRNIKKDLEAPSLAQKRELNLNLNEGISKMRGDTTEEEKEELKELFHQIILG